MQLKVNTVKVTGTLRMELVTPGVGMSETTTVNWPASAA